MNISYNWLKEYVDFNLTPDEVAAALTSIGLETGGVEEVQSIKGGLEGLVIGEVLTCEPHPNSDHMHITTVNLGQGEPVQIVCGAANVAAGQKVVVATLGTKLYDGDECFTIKKSKLRGVESNGMICAEDEIGIGTSHEGIIVLPDDVVPGTLAKDYYNIKRLCTGSRHHSKPCRCLFSLWCSSRPLCVVASEWSSGYFEAPVCRSFQGR